MHELVQNLRENFLNKVCTVLTAPVSFQFKDAIQHSQYFTGLAVDINQYGIWMKHLHVGTYAFFAFPVVGIVEEQVIPQDDPAAEKIVKDLKEKEAQKLQQPAGFVHGPAPKRPTSTPTIMPPNFIPVDSLTNMVRKKKD